MEHPRSKLPAVLVVLFCIALLAGVGVLLWKTLPEKQEPAQAEAIQTDGVFSSEPTTVEPEREEPYEGDLPGQAEAAQPENPDEQPQENPEDQNHPEVPDNMTVSAAGQTAQALLDTMTDDEKLWQLFFVTPEAITNVDTATVAGETTKKALEQYPVGGIVYFAKNLEDREQTVALLENTQSYAKIPLFLGVDEEGGTVSRVGSNPAMGAKEFASAQSLGEQADPAAVYQAGQDIGGTLHAIGFNMDFAPVADVSSGASAVIGSRSFGTDPQLCASLVSIMTQSLTAEEIAPCLKHFPGYGSAITDDHYGTSILTKTQEELEACDFLPFSSGIASGAPFVMVSHLSVPEVVGDETPSDLSSKIVSDLLRNKLGFTGVIITDSHQMASITDHYTSGEAAVKALQAGVDMILMPQDLQAAFDGVKQALSDGTLMQARIDESVLRILQVKAEYNILQ